ncbi:uncharacterized protein LOC124452212 [Xenia sp. Carnegie-2017]|uniref:uncharacterized protein LOC124452212 n=1 Tax=Xenia sp. Carnegie-2017 TaxID=2897299 RepID=UPI001F03C320|nr:uncharacterized protein LOC124452212 [Xenia sp. Carnegie-2017]
MSTRFQKAKVAGCFALKENIKEIASIMVSLNCANIHECKWRKIDGFWAKVLEELGQPNLVNSRKYLYMMWQRNWGGFQNAYESEQQRQTNIAKMEVVGSSIPGSRMQSHEKREKEMQTKAPISGDKNVFIDINDFTPLTCLGENDKSARIQVKKDENMQVEVKTLETVLQDKKSACATPSSHIRVSTRQRRAPKCTPELQRTSCLLLLPTRRHWLVFSV